MDTHVAIHVRRGDYKMFNCDNIVTDPKVPYEGQLAVQNQRSDADAQVEVLDTSSTNSTNIQNLKYTKDKAVDDDKKSKRQLIINSCRWQCWIYFDPVKTIFIVCCYFERRNIISVYGTPRFKKHCLKKEHTCTCSPTIPFIAICMKTCLVNTSPAINFLSVHMPPKMKKPLRSQRNHGSQYSKEHRRLKKPLLILQ